MSKLNKSHVFDSHLEDSLNQKWHLKPTAVYYTIVDEDGCNVCFMNIRGGDALLAQHIIELHNSQLTSRQLYEHKDIDVTQLKEKNEQL